MAELKGGTTIGGNTVWHKGNQGAGSGLDADKLDGKHAPSGAIIGDTDAQTLTNKTLQDSTTFIADNTDATKKVQFEVSAVTTGTTRTLTVPDRSGTIALSSDIDTPSYLTTQAVPTQVISLPSTIVRGQLGAILKGSTRINLINTNSDISLGTTVATGWQYGCSSGGTGSSIMENGMQRLNVLSSATPTNTSTRIHQAFRVEAGQTVTLSFEGKIISGNVRLKVLSEGYDINGAYVVGSSSAGNTYTNTIMTKVYHTRVVPATTISMIMYCWLEPISAGDTGSGYVKNAMVEYSSTVNPYISSGLQITDRLRLKSIGKNFVRNGNTEESESYWTAQDSTIQGFANAGYIRMTIVAAKFLYQNMKLKPNTQYTLSFTGRGQIFMYSDVVFGNQIGNIATTGGDGADEAKTLTFTTSIDGKTVIGLYSNNTYQCRYKLIQIEEGTNSTAYESYKETSALSPVQLRNINTSVYDTFDINRGTYYKNCSDVITLSGIGIGAFGISSLQGAGYKFVTIDFPSFPNIIPDSITQTVWKYNNMPLTPNNAKTGAEQSCAGGIAANCLYIGVSQTDSGWSDAFVQATSFTGMSWNGLSKAYLNGWKFTQGATPTDVATGSWKGIISGSTQSGSAGYAYTVANVDAGYQPYRMVYQISNPSKVYYLPSILTAEPTGTFIEDPYISDVGLYATNVAIYNTSYPILSLDYVNKINVITGALTAISVASCTVAGNGLTFTVTGATAGDFYDYGYTYNNAINAVPSIDYTYNTDLKAQVNKNTDDLQMVNEKTDILNTYFDTKVDKSTYTANDVLTKIMTVDGASSGLDADMIDGKHLTDLVSLTPYSTTNTGASDAGKYTKIAEFQTASQYGNCSTKIMLTSTDDSLGTIAKCTIDWRVKQQLAMGSAPDWELKISNFENVSKTDIVGVITQNDGSLTKVELYVKINRSYSNFIINPLIRTNSGINFFTNQPLIASLPAGTQTACSVFTTSTEDNKITIYNATDTTKAFKFDASSITTATTRTLTVPNSSGTLVLNISGGTTNDIVTRDASGVPIDSGKIFNDAGTTANDIWSAAKTQTAINAIVGSADAMVYKGVLDCSANPNYPAGSAGETYRVSVAGKIGGASGIVVEVNDLIMCNTDGALTGDQATVGSKWNVIQTNIDGAVVSIDTSATDGQIIVESGTSGKIIKKSTASIDGEGKMLTTSLGLGTSPVFLPNSPLAMNGNIAGYVQSNIQNASSGNTSSADMIVTADTGTDTTNYIDFGINSSTYNDATFSITGALGGYLYTSNSDLVIGTALATKVLKFFTGGTLTANERMRIVDTGIILPSTSFINDANGNELIKFIQTASAVNEITVKNNITANAPEISATGGDTNIDIAITPKGTGVVKVSGAITLGNFKLQGNTTDKSLDIIFTG